MMGGIRGFEKVYMLSERWEDEHPLRKEPRGDRSTFRGYEWSKKDGNKSETVASFEKPFSACES